MLKLENITKVYQTGAIRVEAVKDISLSFERGEFVAVLGPSGCGKTTLLNVIGGLDRYTSGDLIISGRSTKDFSEREMDAYRNHAVGFVFQSYNLIPHQSVLANVELALTLTGVGAKERKRRAEQALDKVGLHDQLHKKPSQLSGGQMQRVAIARALVNDPDVLLADEPTGALDSVTSVSVLDLLKDLAKDRLVIMVTHNRDLAEQYATRLIELKDGRVVLDNKPAATAALPKRADSFKKTAMGFRTALALSFNNLLTKRGRTFITAFAGSIGIIGIALILALSNGMNEYIINIQKDTMVSYPITFQEETVQMDGLMDTMRSIHDMEADHALDAVYVNTAARARNEEFQTRVVKNNLTALKQYLQSKDNIFVPYISDVRYDYNTRFNLYATDPTGEIIHLNPENDFGMFSSFAFAMPFADATALELEPASPDGLVGDAVKEKYTLLAGHWPQNADELVLILNSNNEIEESFLYSLGKLKMSDYRESMSGNAQADTAPLRFSYEELLGLTFSWLAPSDMYVEGEGGLFVDQSMDSLALQSKVSQAPKLRITGVIRANDNNAQLEGALGYTRALTDAVIERGEQSAVIKAQLLEPERDLVSGLWFNPKDEAQKAENTRLLVSSMTPAEKALFAQRAYPLLPDLQMPEEGGEAPGFALPDGMDLNAALSMMQAFSSGSDSTAPGSEGFPMDLIKQFSQMQPGSASPGTAGDTQLALMLDAWLKTADDKFLALLYDHLLVNSRLTWQSALSNLGAVNKDLPSGISLYTDTFEKKEVITGLIKQYNEQAKEGDQIVYTDYLAVMISGVTTIINAISYVLIAFVAVSLVVSSIMIGIITYISVLERIKEIGILRAVGASRKDVRRVFTAEAFIIGFMAGALGILISYLLIIPINSIIFQLTKDASVKAILPPSGAVILVAISALLSLLAGWLPSRIAAKKDPVEALRSE